MDWSRSARDLARMVRAFDPWPVAFTFAGGEPLRILRAEADVNADADTDPETAAGRDPRPPPPGTVLRAAAEGIEVQTGAGRLRVLRVQRAGKRPMDARALLNGRSIALGQRLGNGAARRPGPG